MDNVRVIVDGGSRMPTRGRNLWWGGAICLDKGSTLEPLSSWKVKPGRQDGPDYLANR